MIQTIDNHGDLMAGNAMNLESLLMVILASMERFARCLKLMLYLH